MKKIICDSSYKGGINDGNVHSHYWFYHHLFCCLHPGHYGFRFCCCRGSFSFIICSFLSKFHLNWNPLLCKYSLFKHQQLLLFQEDNSSENTIFSFQQSHLHNHLTQFLFSLLSDSEITVSLQYLLHILFLILGIYFRLHITFQVYP